MTPSTLTLIATLLRAPAEVLDDRADTLRQLAPRLLAITLVGAAVFGGVTGAYRGGLQILFAAIKMPILFLAPVAIGLPAVRALFAVDAEAVKAAAARLSASRRAILRVHPEAEAPPTEGETGGEP